MKGRGGIDAYRAGCLIRAKDDGCEHTNARGKRESKLSCHESFEGNLVRESIELCQRRLCFGCSYP